MSEGHEIHPIHPLHPIHEVVVVGAGISGICAAIKLREAGVEDVVDQGGGFEVITDPSELVAARTALQGAGIDYDSAEAEFVPNLQVEVDAETARKVLRLIDALEDSDDVQNVFANFDVSDEVMAEVDA